MTLDIQTGLVLYLPLDDDSGSSYTKDLSPYSNTGELNYISNPNWVDGISGKCLLLDGVQEHVRCGTDSSLLVAQTGWTVSMWIYPHTAEGVSPNRNALYITGASEWWILLNNSNVLLQQMASPWSEISSYTDNIQNNVWYHVGVTSNGDEKKIYVNGVLVKTGNLTVPTATYGRVAYAYTGTDMFDGKVDEIRVYNRYLNASEMHYLYKNPSGTNINLVSALLMITDNDGDVHAITEHIEDLSVNLTLSYASDTFNCVLANYDDEYDFIEFGCEIEIYLGMGGYNTKRLTGIITEAVYTLDTGLIEGRIEMSGEDVGYRSNNVYVFCIIEEEKEISDILKIVLETVDYSTGKSILELVDIDNDYTYIETSDYTSEKTTFAWVPLTTVIKELAHYAGFEWYIDVNNKLHFFDQYDTAVSATITDVDLCDNPRLTIYEKTINRAMVFGGFGDKVDQTGVDQDGFVTVTDTYTKSTSFTPDNSLLSSIWIWTELVSGSTSDLIMKIKDSASEAVTGGTKTVYMSDIVDGGYTEFNFDTFVELSVGRVYTMYLYGTTVAGVDVGVGAEPPNRIHYITHFPYRVASVSNDIDSYDRYGLYTDIFVDQLIEDPTLAAQKSYSMLNGDPKKMADVSIHDDTVTVGDVVTLTLTTPGIKINSDMKVMNSSLKLKKPFLINKLELKEE